MASLEHGRVPSPRPIATREIPLVDRVEEMNLLKEAVYRAVHGEGGLVFIHGEAGIGKTRLVRELGAYARSRGVQVLCGRCPALFRMDGVPPYFPWKEVIRDYLETCTLEQLNRVIGYYPAEVAKLVPEISQKLRAIPQSLPINPEQQQNRLFEAVSQLITNISQETPLLVVLDDLQWTDPSSLLLLHYLARGVQKTPLLLLGAYRSTDVDDKHPLTPVLAELNRERLPKEIEIKRMSFSDLSEMIRNILEQEDVPEEFCRLVYDKTRGNPFFAEEVVKSLKEEGAIYREEDKWKFKEVSTIEFPKSVRNIVKARLSRLSDEYQNVLTLASFAGNDFTLEAMLALTGIEENKLLEIMDGLLRAGFIKHTIIRGEGICSFADIIVRDVVYEEAGPFKRKKLHGIVGSALEKVYAKTIDEHLGELAHHFLQSGDNENALDYFLKAGDKAAKIFANSEATSYYQSALRLLEEKEGDLQERERVLERLGDLESLVGRFDNCLKHWGEALVILTDLQEKERTATLHRKMANTLWNNIGDKEEAKEHHQAALKILGEEPESIELARLYKDVGHMCRRMGDFAAALPLVEKALGLAEKLNAQQVIADSCYELAVEITGIGDIKKGREYANRALKIALDNNYLETALWAYDKVGEVLPGEEYEKRQDCWEKGFALAKKMGVVGWQLNFLWKESIECLTRGELGKAVALGEEGLPLAKKAAITYMVSAFLSSLGMASSHLGEWEKSEAYYVEAMNAARNINEPELIFWCLLGLGELYLIKEECAKAKGFLQEALKLREAVSKLEGMRLSEFLVWTSLEIGEVENAQSLLGGLHRSALEIGEASFKIEEMALEAMLLRVQRKYLESIKRFEQTLKKWKSIKANIWRAYYFAKWVLCEYGRVCLERNENGDGEKALNLLDQALEMFQKMGAKKDIERVEAGIAFIETGKVVSEPEPIDHVSTGYADLDKLLNGGIPSNYAVVLTSRSCDERDLLVKSFLETGTRKDETTFYVTTDPGPTKLLAEEFPTSFFLFVCNAQADAIVKDLPNVFKLKGVENLTELGISLTSAIRNLGPSLKGPRRACIDLISDILLQHHAMQTRRCLSSLIPGLRSEGFTILAVMDPEMHSPQESRAVLDLFDGEINIFEKETEKGVKQLLKVKKMSNQEYLEDEVILRKTA